LAISQNRPCRKCTWKSYKRKIPYVRTCPLCNAFILYKFASGFFAAEKRQSKCEACRNLQKQGQHYKKARNNTQWFRECPKCKEIIFYLHKRSRDNGNNKNSQCRICSDKEHRIRMAHKLLQHNYPRFNAAACNIFNEINAFFGWDGRHAQNMGEFYIPELGYFVDYYEPKLNLVIEYDETHHQRRQMKDIKRQVEIENYLKCKFFRIKENQNWKDILNEYLR
jgi:hypothetical protein